jgi:hypothetical protein
MKIEIIDFKPEHVLDIYPYARGDFAHVPCDQAVAMLSDISDICPTGTIVDAVTRQPVAVANMYFVMPGVAQLHIYTTTMLPKYIVHFSQTMKERLDNLIQINHVHRLQSMVLADKPKWIAWAESFGFKHEGVLRQMLPGKQDAVIMGSIIGEDYIIGKPYDPSGLLRSSDKT